MNANISTVCPQCGATLPASAPAGLCPRCVMAMNLAAQTDELGPGGTKIIAPKTEAPSIAEIAKLFPQFEILEFLGRGGMGIVYKARQPKLDRFIALKILVPNAENGARFAERFQREARTLAKLNHPNIVAIHDFGEAEGFYYLAMEFVEGMNLHELLRARQIKPEEALAIVPHICDGLQYAHSQGVVHRDIKPENILLDKQGRVKIADFGIAKILGADRKQDLTGEQQTIGTPHYMAPEQIEKPTTVDHRADIYSLGVVFYEMLTGELPLGKFALPSKKLHVDVRLDEVVLHALEKEPERRYQHASEVKSDVETIAASPESAPQNPKNMQEPVSKTAERERWLRIKAAGFLVATACFLVAAILTANKDHVLATLLSGSAVIGFGIAAYRHVRAARAEAAVSASDGKGREEVRVNPARTSSSEQDRVGRMVKAPAIGLLVTGFLNWALVPIFAVMFMPQLSRLIPEGAPRLLVFAVPISFLLFCAFVIYAALKMMQLEHRGAAMLASVLAMIVSPGNVVGLPVGIWALVVLNRREVIESFTRNKASSAPGPAHFRSKLIVIAALVIAGGLLITGLVQTMKSKQLPFRATTADTARDENTGMPATTVNAPRVDQVIVEDLALQLLVAIRDKEDGTLQSMASDRIKAWPKALPKFALEMREGFVRMTGKPFTMYPAESLVEGDFAAVKCTGPKELKGVYLVLFYTKTSEGWKNCSLQNSPPTIPLAKHFANFKAQQQAPGGE